MLTKETAVFLLKVLGMLSINVADPEFESTSTSIVRSQKELLAILQSEAEETGN
jgi:hypothetical protein